METLRRQLTLFVDNKDAKSIEYVREKYNPAQFALIAAHVTLCREDEIEKLDNVLKNLEKLVINPITITLGEPKRFSEGKGVLLPATNIDSFLELRAIILRGIMDLPRIQEPHITLVHPRNATCTDKIFEEIKKNEFPKAITFKTISLIEQTNGGRWKILKTFG